MKDKQKTLNQIREFNRFYTVLLGFLNRNYLDSGYSVTETRILFELHQNGPQSANDLIELLHLDKSYISRIIRSFEQKELLLRTAAPHDRRFLIIQLTSKGIAEAQKLIHITNQEILKLIEPFTSQDCSDLCDAMRNIIDLFSDNNNF